MFLNPNHLSVIGLGCSPMLIDWSEQSFLLTFQRIPYGIAGGWRAGYIVITPCKIGWSRYLAGKVNHIIISQGIEAILILQYLMILVEVRVTALHNHILAIPLWERRKEIDAALQTTYTCFISP